MNYIIEGGLDFNSLISKKDIQENTEVNCLITKQKLDSNFIKLPCGHCFSYKALYNEIVSQKVVSNYYNNVKLTTNQIQCPYCRKISNKLLPYIPAIDGVKKIKGVTSPLKYAMHHKSCEKKYIKGKKKGTCCGKSGFSVPGTNLVLCQYHWNLSKQQVPTHFCPTVSKEYINLSKKYTVADLKHLLRENKLKLSGKKNDLIHRLVLNKIL